MWEFLFGLLNKMLGFFSFSKTTAPIQNGFEVYVKSNTGETIFVQLDLNLSSVKNIKEFVGPKLNLNPDEEVKIIFAGKELMDSVMLKECDLGPMSTLHAVKIKSKSKSAISQDPILENSAEGFRSISESLLEHEEIETLGIDAVEETPDQSHLKSHFYVFCSSCNDMKKGKLRVRCSICKGGAFTVHRDPENWTDVLESRQVQGHCECLEIACCEENGSPPFAEFYFKCAEHQSEGEKDFSAPLSLIKANINRIPCLSCADVEDLVLVFPCSLGHVTCLECFGVYLRSKLLERNFLKDPNFGYTVNCPIGCENSIIKDVHHFKLLSKEEYARYQRFATEEYVLGNGGVLCPQPGCGMGYLIEEEGCLRIQCQNGCGFVFCRSCRQGYHLGACLEDDSASTSGGTSSAGVYKIDLNRAIDSTWDDASRTAIRVLTKPCPNCRTATERDGGCMHMVCTRSGCGFEWCWVCQIKWSTECMGAHWFG